MAGTRKIAFVVALIGALAAAVPAQAGGASDVVEAFHAVLLSVMKTAKSTTATDRYKTLESPVEKSFYLPLMISVASGSYWRKADKAKRAELVAAFTRMSVSTYASRFDGYDGEVFKTLGEKPGPRGTVLVRTQIVRPNDDPVNLTYVTKKFGDQWRIVDVLVDEGISELAVRRSEYRTILKKGGVDALITSLNQKSEELLKP